MKKKQLVVENNGLKEKNFASIPEFVEWAVQENGGNYAIIREQLRLASSIGRRMSKDGENVENICTAYGFLTDKEFSQRYNLQFSPNEFTIKGVDNPRQYRLLTCKIAVQKSADNAGIVVTITRDDQETINYTLTEKQGYESISSLTTLHFSDHHLTTEYQGNTYLRDSDGCDHYCQHLSNAAFAFDHKTGFVTDFHYAHTDNDDIFWSRERTKRLPNNKEQDGLTK